MWGRKRLLKLVWNPLYAYYITLKSAKSTGKEMGVHLRKSKILYAWKVFSKERVRGKRKMLKRLFKRRCYAVLKLWREYARVKAARKRIADGAFATSAKWRGYEAWRSWFLNHTRLRRKYG